MGEDRKEIHVKGFPVQTWRRFRSRTALMGVNVSDQLDYVVGKWLDDQDETDQLMRELHDENRKAAE